MPRPWIFLLKARSQKRVEHISRDIRRGATLAARLVSAGITTGQALSVVKYAVRLSGGHKEPGEERLNPEIKLACTTCQCYETIGYSDPAHEKT